MSTLEILKDCGENYKYQGPRFIKLGPDSGEEFRNKYLIPWLNKNKDASELIVDFAGTLVYTPSFLEESFGGSIREGYEIGKKLDFKNIPDKQLIKLQEYIEKAKPEKK